MPKCAANGEGSALIAFFGRLWALSFLAPRMWEDWPHRLSNQKVSIHALRKAGIVLGSINRGVFLKKPINYVWHMKVWPSSHRGHEIIFPPCWLMHIWLVLLVWRGVCFITPGNIQTFSVGFCHNRGTRFDWTNHPIQHVLDEKR